MAKATIDHDEIRRWAEAKGGKPAAVKRTHQDDSVGIIRIMFPDNPQSEHESLVEISWDEFFEQFDASRLALLYDENSLFSKIIGRDTLEHREHREHGEHVSRHHPSDGHRAEHASQSHQGQSHQGQSHQGQSQQSSGGQKRPDDKRRDESGEDLKSREYTDAEGNVHHHTKTYERQHGKE